MFVLRCATEKGLVFFLLDLGECGIHLANVGVGFFTCARPHEWEANRDRQLMLMVPHNGATRQRPIGPV